MPNKFIQACFVFATFIASKNTRPTEFVGWFNCTADNICALHDSAAYDTLK